MGALGDIESMIALADRLYETSSLDPLIVVKSESIPNYREGAEKYYKVKPKHLGSWSVPFKIFDPIETKTYLQGVYPKESRDILGRTESPFNVF